MDLNNILKTRQTRLILIKRHIDPFGESYRKVRLLKKYSLTCWGVKQCLPSEQAFFFFLFILIIMGCSAPAFEVLAPAEGGDVCRGVHGQVPQLQPWDLGAAQISRGRLRHF